MICFRCDYISENDPQNVTDLEVDVVRRRFVVVSAKRGKGISNRVNSVNLEHSSRA
jgi:hypothetical protein